MSPSHHIFPDQLSSRLEYNPECPGTRPQQVGVAVDHAASMATASTSALSHRTWGLGSLGADARNRASSVGASGGGPKSALLAGAASLRPLVAARALFVLGRSSRLAF